MRTRLPFTRSHPSRVMLAVTAAVILITLWLPYSSLAGFLGFVPLSNPYLLIIFGIVALYFISAELTKRWFYRQAKRHWRKIPNESGHQSQDNGTVDRVK